MLDATLALSYGAVPGSVSNILLPACHRGHPEVPRQSSIGPCDGHPGATYCSRILGHSAGSNILLPDCRRGRPEVPRLSPIGPSDGHPGATYCSRILGHSSGSNILLPDCRRGRPEVPRQREKYRTCAARAPPRITLNCLKPNSY